MNEALAKARKRNRVWFYRPDLYWFGWRTLLPFAVGHDEFARICIVIGWDFTGQVVIPITDCGEAECAAEAERYLKWLEEHGEDE